MTCLVSWSAQPPCGCLSPLICSDSWVSLNLLISLGPWLPPWGNVSYSCSDRKCLPAKYPYMKDFPRYNRSQFPPSTLCFKSFLRVVFSIQKLQSSWSDCYTERNGSSWQLHFVNLFPIPNICHWLLVIISNHLYCFIPEDFAWNEL